MKGDGDESGTGTCEMLDFRLFAVSCRVLSFVFVDFISIVSKALRSNRIVRDKEMDRLSLFRD